MYYLRNVEDSERIEIEFGHARRVVIIGAGWIGLENCLRRPRRRTRRHAPRYQATCHCSMCSALRLRPFLPSYTAAMVWTCATEPRRSKVTHGQAPGL